MDKPTSSRHTIKNIAPAGSEEDKELELVIDWLEHTFKAKHPDDITTARIRRKLAQEWKSRRRFALTVLLFTLGQSVGVLSALTLMLAATKPNE
jgi:hypothetical protein